MDNHYLNIFKKVREYFVSPGMNLWGRVRKRLFNSDFPDDEEKSSLKNYEIIPPQELFTQAIETFQQLQLKNSFESLADHEITAPNDSFEKITALINQQQKPPTGLLVRIPTYYKIIAAASVIIIASSIWFFTWNKEEQEAFVKEDTLDKTPLIDSGVIMADTSGTSNKGLHTGSDLKRSMLVNYPGKTGAASLSSISIDGVDIPVENNEILYSFTKYNNGSAIDWRKAEKKTIRLGDYSGISISPFMKDVISDLFKTNKNGKPSAKSKKASAKIKKWRKSDIRSFDKKKNRNPLDIIDLGDNVY